jgi:membrane-associated protease RseP (regulator of RpoE activity)
MSRFRSFIKAVIYVALLSSAPLHAKTKIHWYQPHYMASVEEASNRLQFLSPHFTPLDIGPKWILPTTGYTLERVSENKLGINFFFSKSGVEQKTQYFWSWTGGYNAPVATPYKDDIVVSIVYAEIEYFDIWDFSFTRSTPPTWCVAPVGGSSGKNNVICVSTEADARGLADALATLAVACGGNLRTSSGMTMSPMTDKDLRKHPEEAGCLVHEVDLDGPGAQAGIQQDDILHTVNGTICSKEFISAAIAEATAKPQGGVVRAEIIRKGKAMSVDMRYPQVTVNAAQLQQQIANLSRQNGTSIATPPAPSTVAPPSGVHFGFQVRPVIQDDMSPLQLTKAQGLVVVGVENGSLADTMGILAGDVILQLNGADVSDMQQFVQTIRSGAASSFRVWRKGQTVDLTVPVSM